MKRLARMGTKKSHSWWWDSHISPKNSKWLEENLLQMDQCVKEMLKLIEEEGDSFAKKAEMYYQKRPELITHVEDFYRMYRALAERYDNVMGELRKNIPSELQSHGSGSGSDFGFEPSPEVTPERKRPGPKAGPRAAGFEFFLGSGGSSDLSRKGSDGSSTSSESDSDYDGSKDAANNDDDTSELHQRILALENELRDVKERLYEFEGKASLEKDPITEDEKLHVVDPDLENNQVPELEELIAVMESEISQYKKEIESLKERVASADQQFAADLSNRDNEIKECSCEKARLEASINELKGQFAADLSDRDTAIEECSCEKAQLEASINELKGQLASADRQFAADLSDRDTAIKEYSCEKARLESSINELKIELRGILQEKSLLVDQVSGLSDSHGSLEAKVILLEDEIKQLEGQNGKHTAKLNENLDAFKLKVDMLTSEKEELGAEVSRLVIDMKGRNQKICEMNEHLHELHLEHVKLISEVEEARGAREELRSRVKELEEEVERQRAVAVESAEGKREAIRQLCFSLEHYRDGYHQLRQVLQGHKRITVMAA